jgi:alkane 1-monooxygenase
MRLCEVLVAMHFLVLVLTVAGVSGATGLGLLDGIALLVAGGLYLGQVGGAVAHELIHTADPRQRRVGRWMLIALLHGHHETAHLRIHHRYVATPDDPATPRLGEGFYGYAGRAWLGGLTAGWEIERSLARLRQEDLPWWRHPYAEYLGGALVFLLAATFFFGPSGLIAILLVAGFAQGQILLLDYIQHYGLRRRRIDDEDFEPVAPWHAWNAPHRGSAALTLNATRHSDHHMNAARPFAELSLPDAREAPRLPLSLPVMAAMALVPPLWRWRMDRTARGWQKRIDEGRIAWTPAPPPVPAESAAAESPEPESAAARGMAAPAYMPLRRTPRPRTPHVEEPATPRSAGIERPVDEVADDLLRRLRDADPGVPEHLRRRAERERTEAVLARTPVLWADALPAEAGAATLASEAEVQAAPSSQPIPSARLFQPDLLDEEPLRQARPGRTERQALPVPEPAEIEDAVARTVAADTRSPMRKRSVFPSLEPADDQPEPGFREKLRMLGRCARIAALSLGPVLHGLPASRQG